MHCNARNQYHKSNKALTLGIDDCGQADESLTKAIRLQKLEVIEVVRPHIDNYDSNTARELGPHHDTPHSKHRITEWHLVVAPFPHVEEYQNHIHDEEYAVVE